MQTALKLNATVLPGHRIEITAPSLPEGAQVELIVMLPEEETDKPREYVSVMDFLASLPPSNLTLKDWERIENEIQMEKDAWES